MITTINNILSKALRSANETLKNEYLQEHQLTIMPDRLDVRYHELISHYADTFLILNGTPRDVMVTRGDGTVMYIKSSDSPSINGYNYRGRLLFIDARSLVLSDRCIAEAARYNSDKGYTDPTSEFEELLEQCKTSSKNFVVGTGGEFPYQIDMQKDIHDALLCIGGDKGRYYLNSRRFHNQAIINGSFNVARLYSIEECDLPLGTDWYVEYLNVLIRPLENRDDLTAGRKRLRRTKMTHPMTKIDAVRLLETENSILSNTGYTQRLDFITHPSYTSQNEVYLVRDREVIKVNIDKTSPEEGGYINVTKKDEGGSFRTYRHSMDEMRNLNLFWTYQEAYQVLQRDSVEDAVINERIEKIKKETQAKEEYTNEKIREASVLKDKNKSSTTSDVLKLIGTAFGLVASVAAATVAVMRMFVQSRVASWFMTRAVI